MQIHNDIPHTFMPKCIRESEYTVKELRTQYKKGDTLHHRAYRFLQKERENDKGSGKDQPGRSSLLR